MKTRQIEVSTDTFAALWSKRLPEEHSEDDIIKRILGVPAKAAETGNILEPSTVLPPNAGELDHPPSVRWTELLVWSLKRLGGEAPLGEIYRVSREGRRSLGRSTTLHHDDSARECLESHCSESKKYRGKADLFWMPHGKGAGIWALR